MDQKPREAGPLSEIGPLCAATGVVARLRGLHACGEECGVLLLAPCCDIHTFGMDGPIDVAFAGKDGVVVASRRDLPPGRRMAVRGAACVLERRAKPGRAWFCPGDRLGVGVYQEV